MKREKFLCHFIHEGKPSPVIFTSFSLTISSHKRTEIKFVAFMAFMMEDGASLVAHIVKSLPAKIPGQEDPLEKEMATHFSILAWRIPQMEEPGRLHPWGQKE